MMGSPNNPEYLHVTDQDTDATDTDSPWDTPPEEEEDQAHYDPGYGGSSPVHFMEDDNTDGDGEDPAHHIAPLEEDTEPENDSEEEIK